MTRSDQKPRGASIVLLSKAARLERRAGNGALPDERADLLAAGRFYREWYGQEPEVIRSTQAHNLERGAKGLTW